MDLKTIINKSSVTGIQLAYFSNDSIERYNIGLLSPKDLEIVTDATVFCAGSLSKSVFAYGVLRLFDHGVLDLDTPLLTYIQTYTRFPSIEGEFRKITARMVLNHTTGLPNWSDGPKTKLLFRPGSYFLYSGEGYLFLQTVIEHRLGKPINEIMRDEVFRPLRMGNSVFADTTDEKIHRITSLKAAAMAERPNVAFSLSTNALDYYNFLQALMNGYGLKQMTHLAMISNSLDVERFYPPPTVFDKYLNWGLGVGLQSNENGQAIWHWGAMDDFRCFYLAFPARKEGLVYFTQSPFGLKITSEVINLLLGKQTCWAIKCLDYE